MGGCLQGCIGQDSLTAVTKPWSPLASHRTHLFLTHVAVPRVGRLWSSFRAPDASLCLPCRPSGLGVPLGSVHLAAGHRVKEWKIVREVLGTRPGSGVLHFFRQFSG